MAFRGFGGIPLKYFERIPPPPGAELFEGNGLFLGSLALHQAPEACRKGFVRLYKSISGHKAVSCLFPGQGGLPGSARGIQGLGGGQTTPQKTPKPMGKLGETISKGPPVRKVFLRPVSGHSTHEELP